jgi:hypothetical protein
MPAIGRPHHGEVLNALIGDDYDLMSRRTDARAAAEIAPPPPISVVEATVI